MEWHLGDCRERYYIFSLLFINAMQTGSSLADLQKRYRIVCLYELLHAKNLYTSLD